MARADRAQLEDAEGGIATYVAGIAIHVIDLSSGRDLIIDIPNEGPPAHAQLTPAGLFYSYNQTYTELPGRAVFVSMQALRPRLR